MTTTSVDLRARAEQLVEFIQNGKIIEAMSEFYTDDVQMQENSNPATIGQAANIEREKQFLDNVAEWRGFTVKSLTVGDGVTAIENVIEFKAKDGSDVVMEQIAVQRWRGDKIEHERFYYDASSK
ncbi:MAG: nuclear transport factor 2 family protein [Planctomycetota bacterium]